MTKYELTERVVDALIDPWTDCAEDYMDCTPVNISEASNILKDIREMENSCDLDEDERLPEEVTPSIIMETFNCLLRARKHEARIERLANYLKETDHTCEYDNYYVPAHKNAVRVIPIDFLYNCDVNNFPFPVKTNLDIIDIITIGKNSPDFDFTREYCWYDEDKKVLHSTDNPFADGTIDTEAFARFILEDEETADYMFNYIIDDKDIEYILGCTKEEYENE